MHEQGTDEWFAARLGKITASKVSDVMMKPTTAGYQNYMTQLICERLTGVPTETFQSAAMLQGTETEPQARAMYELTTSLDVEKVGFVDHAVMPMVGASPDGLVGADGLIEIKCPQPTEHMRMVLGGEIQRKYVLQMHLQMMCAEREWCDFVSFSPTFPDHLQLDVRRVVLDAEVEDEITAAIISFTETIEAKMKVLQQREAA